MKNTTEYRFSEIMEGFYDGPHATPPLSDNGPIFLGIKNIREEGGIDYSQIRHISQHDFKKWTKRVTPQKDDIVFSYEATLHRYALIPPDFNGCLGRRMALIRVDKGKANAIFLYQYFLSPQWKSFVETVKIGGATVDRISILDFPKYKIHLPPLPIQQKIASILSAYDDLIENNNQRIKLLEDMAEEIYKEWFVRLRFPGYKDATFIDPQGKVVPHGTPCALPDGWCVSKLENYIRFFRGKSYSSEELRDRDGIPMLNLKNVARGGGFRRDGLKYFEGKYSKKNEAASGDIIMAVTDMTQEREIVGRVARVPKMNQNKFIFSMDLVKIEPIDYPAVYFYAFFRFSGIGHQLKEMANGANVLHLTPGLILLQEALVPSREFSLLFEKFATPILEEIDILEQKNELLHQTRDLLLPRLMNGKLNPGKLPYQIPEVPLSMVADHEVAYQAKEK